MVSIKGSSEKVPSRKEVKSILTRVKRKKKGGEKNDVNKRFKR